MTALKKIWYCSLLLFLPFLSNAQSPSQPPVNIVSFLPGPIDSSVLFHITAISIKGNRKTKEYIIRREIQFSKGDSITPAKLRSELVQARQQVYNTSLFNEVKIQAFIFSAGNVEISVEVKERWYIYPIPQFKIVDRNINEWIKTYKASLDHVNYGLKFVDYNLSGTRDQLRVYLTNGYSRDISASYSNPNSNSKLSEGFAVAAGYSQNREIPYKTDSTNKILTYKKGDFVRNGYFFNAGYSKRQGFFIRHSFSISYTHLSVDDSIITAPYNPNYFKSHVTAKGFPDFAYDFRYVNVDNISYSLKGKAVYLTVLKRGLGFTGGLNMFAIDASFNRYFSLGNKWYSSVQFNGKLKLPFDQAYFNQGALGYGDAYLRGLEYYVVDGSLTGLMKTTLKKKIFYFSIPFPFHSKSISKIPFTFYAKTFADIGYAYNKPQYDTYLNNRFLYTYGFGLDILTLYDLNLRFEFSFNQLHENGLFLHTQSGF